MQHSLGKGKLDIKAVHRTGKLYQSQATNVPFSNLYVYASEGFQGNHNPEKE